jgi:predicted amidophosphoribosyltransferase
MKNFNSKEYCATRRTNFKNQGLCPKCGKEREDKKFSYCSHCREVKRRYHRNNSYMQNLRKHRKENNLCSRCGKDKEEGRGYCEKCRIEVRNYHRRRCIGTTAGYIGKLNKRLYPKDQKCELCNLEKKRLPYHHWDDYNPSKGIWMCNRCHTVVTYIEEGIEKRVVSNYKYLKTVIDNYENSLYK